jgi:hypothetical protein
MKPSLVRKAPASTMPIANNWRAGLAGAFFEAIDRARTPCGSILPAPVASRPQPAHVRQSGALAH